MVFLNWNELKDAPAVLGSKEPHQEHAERLNAKVCVTPNLSFLDESLILAQDERWRRA